MLEKFAAELLSSTCKINPLRPTLSTAFLRGEHYPDYVVRCIIAIRSLTDSQCNVVSNDVVSAMKPNTFFHHFVFALLCHGVSSACIRDHILFSDARCMRRESIVKLPERTRERACARETLISHFRRELSRDFFPSFFAFFFFFSRGKGNRTRVYLPRVIRPSSLFANVGGIIYSLM